MGALSSSLSRPARRTLPILICLVLGVGAGACDDAASAPTQAFGSPIDFSYACEGDGATVAPDNFEGQASFQGTQMCAAVPALVSGTFQDAEGTLIGAVLSRSPPRVHLIQMNPHSRSSVGVLDTNDFVPGFNGIPVGLAPIRLVRASDWSAFYVISAGDQDVTRVSVTSVQGADGLQVETSRFDLPGVPSDAMVHGDSLVVSSARSQQLWIFDLAADPKDPPVVAIDLDGVVHTMQPLGDDLLVTWEDRPIVSRLSLTSSARTDAGIRPACSDTLDNDGDGQTDAGDPDCRDGDDPSEDGPLSARPAADLAALTGYPSGVHACEDGLDNDLDGFTDADDTACADPHGDGETLPACMDGIDNDLDGLTDTDDESCYGAFDRSEGQLGPFGPYQATVVDAAPYGTFVYALDLERRRLVVLDADDDLARVSTTAQAGAVPAVPYERYKSPGVVLEGDELPAINKVPFYGPAYQGKTDLRMTGGLGNSLSAGRLRGEIWGRIIAPGEDGSVSLPRSLDTSLWWAPPGCDPIRSTADLCVMPATDDATWYVFVPTMEGRIQLIEAVRRGVVLHRHAQDVEEVDLRGSEAGRPSLKLRGERISVGSSLPEGFPFLGPLTEELLEERVEGVSPRRYRQYGVWGLNTPEGVETEAWEVTYEGAIPGATGALARFISPTTLYDPAAQFCTDGVEPGDWLVLSVAPDTVPPSLRYEPSVEVMDGTGAVTGVCPVEPPRTAEIEVPVVTVGQTSLVIDPSAARLRPVPPVLDADALEASDTVSISQCADALDELKRTLTFEAKLPPTDAFEIGNLPRSLMYSVRARAAWTVIGSRTGYLHRNVWSASDGLCVLDGKTPDWPEPPAPVEPGAGATDEELATWQAEVAAREAWEQHEASYAGRLEQLGAPGTSTAVSYSLCTPALEEINAAGAALFHPDPDHPVRFRNFSFELEVFPGCEPVEDGSVALVESQRDTTWTFQVAGPDNPRAATVKGALHGVRVPLLDFRRQQMQLDTSGRQVHQLEIRADGADHLATYD